MILGPIETVYPNELRDHFIAMFQRGMSIGVSDGLLAFARVGLQLPENAHNAFELVPDIWGSRIDQINWVSDY